MNQQTRPLPAGSAMLPVPHVVRGRRVEGAGPVYRSRDMGTDFTTPALDLDTIVWGRQEALPALQMPIAEVVAFLVDVGQALDLRTNTLLQESYASMLRVSTLGERVMEQCYRDLPGLFGHTEIMAELQTSIGDLTRLDGWAEHRPMGHPGRLRAFPPRLLHVLAGNTPLVAALTIIRAALTKGVHLLKLASNDLYTPTAILGTMERLAPDHPVTRSFSAVYWRGGDASVEALLCTPQYLDKIVVWGGESAVRNALKYVGPGLELVSFDPKMSISMIGAEAIANDDKAAQAARLAADDVMVFNQDACSASRYQFVEGGTAEVDVYCAHLARELGLDRRYGDGQMAPPPAALREEVEGLEMLEPYYRVFGKPDGTGLVVRSDEPVSFHPDFKTVNVVRVDRLSDALPHVTVATQTVGIYPPERKRALRDGLAAAGAQRIVTLGGVIGPHGYGGLPHDGSFPLQRMMRWIIDEGED